MKRPLARSQRALAFSRDGSALGKVVEQAGLKRFQRALLLPETAASIKEIAEQTGYRDRYFFSKHFKQHTGLTPREFRQREAAGAPV